LIDGPRDQSTNLRAYLYYRIASSEPADYTAALTGTAAGAAAMLAYTGTDPVSPVQATSPAGTEQTSQTPTTASIVPAGDNYMLVAFYGCDAGASRVPISPQASPLATERVEVEQAAFVTVYVQEYLQTSAASQALSMTAAASDIWVMQIVALKPAPSGPTPPYVSVSIA
jgi:hypothetical protein